MIFIIITIIIIKITIIIIISQLLLFVSLNRKLLNLDLFKETSETVIIIITKK